MHILIVACVFPCPSEEDTDIKALVRSWLQNQSEEERRVLEPWLEDYFYKALDWVYKQNDLVVETTRVGLVMNGLSHMHGVRVKQQFVCSLIRGLGANLSANSQTSFAKEVRNKNPFHSVFTLVIAFAVVVVVDDNVSGASTLLVLLSSSSS